MACGLRGPEVPPVPVVSIISGFILHAGLEERIRCSHVRLQRPLQGFRIPIFAWFDIGDVKFNSPVSAPYHIHDQTEKNHFTKQKLIEKLELD